MYDVISRKLVKSPPMVKTSKYFFGHNFLRSFSISDPLASREPGNRLVGLVGSPSLSIFMLQYWPLRYEVTVGKETGISDKHYPHGYFM